MTKKDFDFIVARLVNIRYKADLTDVQFNEAVSEFSKYLKLQNPKFNADKFWNAITNADYIRFNELNSAK